MPQDTNSTPGHHDPTTNATTLLRPDCVLVRFSLMEYLPDIVNDDVEGHVRSAKNYLLTVLIFIGGPANIINMAVFCKQSLRDRVNLCLFSLSFADEIYLVSASFVHGEHVTVPLNDFGPIATFLVNHNLNAFNGCVIVSFIMSAMISSERCLCVLSPLKFQTLLRTRTTAVFIVTVYALTIAAYYIVNFRYHIGCVHDPELGIVLNTMIENGFYQQHKRLIDVLDTLVLGTGFTGAAMVVVVTATTITVVKLRQTLTWRVTTTSSSSSLSAREVALTKMLVGSSVLFIVCVSPTCLLRVACLFVPEMTSGGRYHNFYFTCLWATEGFVIINASFNFFVYYKMGSKYRETFWALFGGKCSSGKRATTTK